MAYTSDSATDRLAAVRSAIDRCLTSQDYSIRGRRQVMAELSQLRDLERDLMEEVNLSSDGQMVSLAIQTRPA